MPFDPDKITPEDVRRAAKDIDENPHDFHREPAKYFVIVDGKNYPPIEIMRRIYLFHNGNLNDWIYVGGTMSKIKYLRQAGFFIKNRKNGAVLPPLKNAEQKIAIPTMQAPTYPKNIILYGPPGTGKTYNSVRKAVEIATNGAPYSKEEFDRLQAAGQIEFVTFHQNYSYEDFIVGISPDVSGEGALRFKREKGIFKRLVERARENWANATQQTAIAAGFEKVWALFLQKLYDEDGSARPITIPMKREGVSFAVFDYNEDKGSIHFEKKDGSKNHNLSLSTLKKIYENDGDYTRHGLGVYYYPLVAMLKDLAKQHQVKETLKNYVLLIDEINRANISRVFGELITLIEDDKRLGEENALTLTLPSGERNFGIPPNLYIIGTMNTADKSIALVDIALRRRFEFWGYYPQYTGYLAEAANLLQKLNANIHEAKKSADFLIGHAYLIAAKNRDDVQRSIERKIIPLLMEYFSNKTEAVEKMFAGTNWAVKYTTDDFSWKIALPA